MHQNYSHHLWLQIAPVCLFITGWGNAYWCSRFLEPALIELLGHKDRSRHCTGNSYILNQFFIVSV